MSRDTEQQPKQSINWGSLLVGLVAFAVLLLLLKLLWPTLGPALAWMKDYEALKEDRARFWGLIVGFSALVIGVLVVLHFMPSAVRRRVIVVLTFLAGAIFVLDFFWPEVPSGTVGVEPGSFWGLIRGETDGEPHWLTATTGRIGNILQVVMGFTFLLGIYNLIHVHGNNIRRRRPAYINSIAFFVAFILMAGSAFWRDWYVWFGNAEIQFPPSFILDPNAREGATPAPGWNPLFANDAYTYLFRGLYVNLEASMFSILAFYIVSAAYRAFRIRSAEAGILMITAMILMLGQVPIGMWLTHTLPEEGIYSFFRLENFSLWVLSVINSPVQRAIDFGLGLGALAMSLRIWLSLERGTYFGQEV